MLPEKIKLPKKIDSDELLPPNMDYPYFERVRHTGFLYEEDDFSLENSCFLAESSLLVYCHPAFIKYAFYYAGLYNFRSFIGKKVARCFTAGNSDYLVVAFRGTEMKGLRSVPGFIADLKITMTKEKTGGLVHSGFREVLDEIWEGEDKLYSYLSEQKNKNPNLRVFFTGHSLGGALALIAASRFPDTDCVYTYGCPRAGNRAFTDSIKASVYRTVNNNDIVTTLPSKKILYARTGEEYTHKGILKFIDEKGKIKNKILNKFASDGGSKEKEIFLTLGVDELIMHLGKTRRMDFFDHSPFYYAAKLWNAYRDINRGGDGKSAQPLQSP